MLSVANTHIYKYFCRYNYYEPSTTLWESWNVPTMQQWLSESSRGHHFMTGINTFLRKYVAGLDMPAGAAGWSIVRIRPEAAAPLNDTALEAAVPWAGAVVDTHRGRVEVSWARVAGGGVRLNCSVPPSATGEVHFPARATGPVDTTVSESGVLVWADGRFVPGPVARGITAARDDGRFIVITVLSGQYAFVG